YHCSVQCLTSLLPSAAYGIKCYGCLDENCFSLKNVTCPSISDRCFTITTAGKVISKGCGSSSLCVGPGCCDTDMCNGAVDAGPGAFFLLLSTALITLFL
uniref:UPAR/Ly6 domain-containing protein n=1 Tax=Esox lucius TaxID=8010 RepID=A0AAY5K8N1_ESOLU